MVEKAGVPHSVALKHKRSLHSCAANIARWWLTEHYEKRQGIDGGRYPGDRAMDRRLIPTALWLGMKEFGGFWRELNEEIIVIPRDRFQFLRDYKNEAILDALTVRGSGPSSERTWRPSWYRSEFIEWANDLLKVPKLPNPAKHDPTSRDDWCGVPNCPYPYASEIYPCLPDLILAPNVLLVREEKPTPIAIRTPLRWKGDEKKKSKKRKRGE